MKRRALAASIAVLALATACSRRTVQDDIVLITVDTLRADRLGLYGYGRGTTPQLDRWFADGVVHERAYATAASTSPSVVSLLTGLYPSEHRVRLLYQLVPDDVRLVTDWLPASYQTAAVVSNVVLTEAALGIARRFDHYDAVVDEKESGRDVHERRAERTTDAAVAWVGEQADPARPLFLWVHYIDPHGPYRAPDPWHGRMRHRGSVPVEPERILAYMRLPGVADALDYVDRYDEEVAYVDASVDRLLRALEARRGLDRTLVAFTADHGETMAERRLWFRHGWHVFDEIVRVPLLLRGPGVEKGRSAIPVSGVDVVPTLLRHAGVPLPAGWSDVDLRRVAVPSAERPVFSEATVADGRWLAAVQGKRKAMLQVYPERRLGASLAFDLATDPSEDPMRLAPEGDALVATLAARAAQDAALVPDVAGARDGPRATGANVDPRVGGEAEAQLRALGYLE
jgi:arylsulfatase